MFLRCRALWSINGDENGSICVFIEFNCWITLACSAYTRFRLSPQTARRYVTVSESQCNNRAAWASGQTPTKRLRLWLGSVHKCLQRARPPYSVFIIKMHKEMSPPKKKSVTKAPLPVWRSDFYRRIHADASKRFKINTHKPPSITHGSTTTHGRCNVTRKQTYPSSRWQAAP